MKKILIQFSIVIACIIFVPAMFYATYQAGYSNGILEERTKALEQIQKIEDAVANYQKSCVPLDSLKP